jgi:hypothetical protein
MTIETRAPAYEAEIRLILRVAMVLFIYTVAIGILNGLDLVTFDRRPLLAHLHIGTLGWITMAVFAASLWLFAKPGEERPAIRWIARAAPAVAFLYNVAFLTTDGIARPIFGTLMLVIIVVFFLWAAARARETPLSVPHLGILAGLATSVLGAVLGILNGVRLAQTDSSLPETLGDAHPATMVVGFLVPLGMAFAEWVMRPASIEDRAARLGQLQIGLPFVGAIVLVIGILIEADPLAALSLLFEVAGLAIFLWRLWPVARHISWLQANTARHGPPASLFLIVNIAILVYLISNYIDDFEAAPRRLALALDHSIFVGVLTNTILALLSTTLRTPRPEWVDHAVFWGVNIGAAGFVLGLLADVTPLLRVFTPLLGAAILLAIGVHLAEAVREIRTGRPELATPPA